MSSADRFSERDFWTSRGRSGLDHRMGRNATAAAIGGQSNGAPGVCDGGQNHAKSWIANWINRRGGGGSVAILRQRIGQAGIMTVDLDLDLDLISIRFKVAWSAISTSH